MRRPVLATLGISTGTVDADELSFEKLRVCEEGKAAYDEVVLIDPRTVVYRFIRGQSKPGVDLGGRDLSGLDTLVAFGTSGIENSTAVLVRSLGLCGCDVFDPVDRFPVGQASKLLTTVERFQRGVGIDSFIAFDSVGALRLVRELDREGRFPLLMKPIAGRKGRGIVSLPDEKAALHHVEGFFKQRKNPDIPVFLQRQVGFRDEYRVLVIDGEAVGIASKQPQTGSLAANAAQGAEFTQSSEPGVMSFAARNVSAKGILGVDVAVDAQGEKYIIEANRAPLWRAFEEATGVNVARSLVKRAAKRLRPES
jgi:hypothetical protein